MDARIGAFESHVLDWRSVFLSADGIEDRSDSDVMACAAPVSGLPFNMVLGARFDDWVGRAREVADWYLERGMSWCWWTTPSTTSPELEGFLAEIGMVPPQGVGMHRELSGFRRTASVAGVDVQSVPLGEPSTTDALLSCWGMPDDWRPYWQAHGEQLAKRDAVTLVATEAGELRSFGIGYLSEDGVWGLWIIGTPPDQRRRGLGSLITDALLAEGVRRGAREAVLGASESGQPVYARFGFEALCRTTQWLWTPPEARTGE